MIGTKEQIQAPYVGQDEPDEADIEEFLNAMEEQADNYRDDRDYWGMCEDYDYQHTPDRQERFDL